MSNTPLDKLALYLFNRDVIKSKFENRKTRNPAYIRAEVGTKDVPVWSEKSMYEIDDMDEDQLLKLITVVNWIYANIELIARDVRTVPMHLKRKDEKVEDHQFLELMRRPNPFMSRSYLLSLIVYWLSVSRNGAFLYLSPDVNNPRVIREIWPINSKRVEVIPDKRNFVKTFLYTPSNNTDKPIRINPEYVVWFRYPSFDYWESLPPLLAAISASEIELGVLKTQKKAYTESRGIPLSLVSVSEDLNDTDFARVRNAIREDWENDGTTVAIARAGTIDIKSVGISAKDLEIMSAQQFTRDKIDSAFFGFPIRSDAFQSGEGLKQLNKFISEKTIYPLLVLLQEELTLQMLEPFWPNEKLTVMFEDVRIQDRALGIQEMNVTSRWSTIDEMRQLRDMKPIEVDDDFEGYGNLPVMLASNPAFIMKKYGIDIDPNMREPEQPDNIGNLPESLDPQATVNNLTEAARDDIAKNTTLADAAQEGVRVELTRMLKVYRKSPDDFEFKTKILPAKLVKFIFKDSEKIESRIKLSIDMIESNDAYFIEHIWSN